jgi:hypothetical protein
MRNRKEERRKERGKERAVGTGEVHDSVELQLCCLGGGEMTGKFSTTWVRRCEALARDQRSIKVTCAATSNYLECQPHILPLFPALASHREESPQRHRKKPREFKDSQIIIKPLVLL